MREYGGLLWTKHALSRLKERGITQDQALFVWKHPTSTRYAKVNGAWVYRREVSGKDIELVAKKEKGQWVIISSWVKESYYKKHQDNFILRLFKQIVGL